MALVTQAFFDTSILLAGLIELGETSELPQKLMDGVAAGKVGQPCTAWHCCLEFYSVSTRLPEEFRLAPQEALRLIEEELFARFQVHQLPRTRRKNFFQFAVRDKVIGGRIYDSHIAEIAKSAGVQLVVTENQRDFVGLLRHGIRVLSADEFLDELR
ncbi:MAG: type II toxin-antitoxin system VapC family toxin [Acidobacteriota bacterium]